MELKQVLVIIMIATTLMIAGSKQVQSPVEIVGMILFWDGTQASIPAGWECISCSAGQPFYEKYLNVSTKYGTTGGSSTHDHDLVIDTSFPSATVGALAGFENGANCAGTQHTHEADNTKSWVVSNTSLPITRSLLVIKYITGVPDLIPAGAIGFFNATSGIPTGYTSYTAENNFFIMGNSTVGNLGRANHTHFGVNLTTGNADTGDSCLVAGVGTFWSVIAHLHTLKMTNFTTPTEHTPPFINLPMIKAFLTDQTIPKGFIAVFNATPNSSFLVMSSAKGKFIVGNSSAFNTTGGQLFHNHTGARMNVSSVGVGQSRSSGVLTVAINTHTHQINVSSTNEPNLPPYISVILGIYTAVPIINNAPNTTAPKFVPAEISFTNNLTCINGSTKDINGDLTYNIYDFRNNDTGTIRSELVLNMPFDTQASSTTGTTVMDYSTFQRNGTFTSLEQDKPVWTSSGYKAGAFDFNGSQFFNVSNFTKSDKVVSATVWVNARTRTSLNTILKNWGAEVSPNDKGQFHFGLSAAPNTRLSIFITEADGTQIGDDQTPFNFPLNSWQHVGFVANGTKLLLYMNGTDVDSTPASYDGTLRISFDCLGIGYKPSNSSCKGNGGQFWDGQIDEIKIWDKALTSQEIMQDYNDGVNKYVNITKTNTTINSTGQFVNRFLNGTNWSCCVTPTDTLLENETKCVNYTIPFNVAPITIQVIQEQTDWRIAIMISYIGAIFTFIYSASYFEKKKHGEKNKTNKTG